MTITKAHKAFKWLETHWPWILAPLLVGTSLLWTFALDPIFKLQNLVRGIFYALQFVVLNKDIEESVFVSAPSVLLYGLIFAQFTIPLIASVAFFGALFREQITPFWYRQIVKQLAGHHVIIGHGAVGSSLSQALSNEKKDVVVIDLLSSVHLYSARLFHLQCDARSPKLFDLANLAKADRIYLLLPDERTNIAILESLAARNWHKNVTVFVRAESNELRRLLADWVWLKTWLPNGKLDVRPISPYDVAARGVVNEYSPDLFAPTDRSGKIAQTVMIVGVSEMSKALILRFARLGVYSREGKLRLIWLGKGVTEAFAELADSYPSLRPSNHSNHHWGMTSDLSTEFFQLVVSPLDIIAIDQSAAQSVRDRLVSDACGDQAPSVVYVCHDSDIKNAIDSRDLQATLSTHLLPSIKVYEEQRLILTIQNNSVIGIAQSKEDGAYSLLPYGIREVCIDTLFAETVVSDRADDLAKKFDAAWSTRALVDPVAWNSSPFFLKETNRDPADHAAIKARFSGMDPSKVKACFIDGLETIGSDDDILDRHHDDLQFMEMRRYRAFMFLHAFSHAPSSKNKDLDRCKRTNETLLDEYLSSDQKIKDSDIVNIMKMASRMSVLE